ncbi:MAG: hypothetical protein KUG82_15420 [Pseudomonadales bacterium]|nr:hypothetical protein [Pseudomonadales bacterium]
MTKSRINEQAWLDHYEQCLKERVSITGYAKKTGINVSSFHSAVKRLRTRGLVPDTNTQERFVKVIHPYAQPNASFKMTLPSGMLVELDHITLDAQCVQFIQALERR